MNAGVGVGLIVLAVLLIMCLAAWRVRRGRRLVARTPAEKYRREVEGLKYRPQTWRTKRAAAVRKQNRHRWAAGAAGGAAAGGFVAGGHPGNGESGCSAGGCGGGGCGGGGGGCGGGS